MLLEVIQQQKYTALQKQPPEIFQKSLQYAKKFGGAVEAADPAAIDDLYESLRSMEVDRTDADGHTRKDRLDEYEVSRVSQRSEATSTRTSPCTRFSVY
jgi:hypothetical protein